MSSDETASPVSRDERIRSTALDKALNARRLGEDDQVTVARAEAFHRFLDPNPTADDWGPGQYRIMRLGRDWSPPWRGIQMRLGSFGGTNDEATAVIEIRREGDESEADR